MGALGFDDLKEKNPNIIGYMGEWPGFTQRNTLGVCKWET